MKSILLASACLALLAAPALAQSTSTDKPAPGGRAQAGKPSATTTASPDQGVLFHSESSETSGAVNVEGHPIDYRAVAGTIIVHPKGWDDAAAREQTGDKAAKDLDDKANPDAEASMFYVAYFKKGVPSADRPITFIYNGGPGSSTVWLHMGAFGPRRVVTADDTHTPAAPYRLVDNAYSLLDASDLVFIDAPGTGFSRIAGKDKEKAFYGVDVDGHAFSQFIMGFLSKYGRWDSPKYLFGESYGTPRSAVVVNELETGESIDFNGVILLSQILNFDLSADSPELNPGTDEAYIVTLPTYAATAWYHNRLAGGRPADLQAYLREVEQFATTDYALALQQGSELDPARKQAVAERVARYTGLPVAYVLKANLRVDGGEFEKTLQDADGPDHRPARHPLLRPLNRPAEQGGRLRPAVRRHQLGLCVELQRLCQEGPALRRGQDLQARDRRVQVLAERPPAAGSGPAGGLDPERHARSRPGDEVQSRAEGDGQRRLLRPRHPLLRGLVRGPPPADPRQLGRQSGVPLLPVRPYGLRP